MENHYDDIVLLERYVDGTLSAEDSKQLELRLSIEPGLRELFSNEKLLVNGIRYSHLKNKLEELRHLELGLPALLISEKESKVFSLSTYWKPLSAIAAVLALGITFLLWDRPINLTELYTDNFQAYPNIIEPMNRGNSVQNQRAEALAAYENQDYAKAVEGFKAILASSNKPEPEILLLLGNANLMLNRTAEARDNFITLSKDFDTYDAQAKWFLSLCYLKMGNIEATKVVLEELAAGGSSYEGKAKELLKKLK